MASIWITYAWVDNQNSDVDFVAQELSQAGLEVKLDRWNLSAGKRLWEQIESFILSPVESDAWLLVATNNSLASEPCKEEFAYALDRALKCRGDSFPVIALFLSRADPTLIPAGIRTRLYVSITDPDWKERIVAAAQGRPHAAVRPDIQPYVLNVHRVGGSKKPIAIEVRPRAGVWAPFIAAIPASEMDTVKPSIMIGPRDVPTGMGALTNTGNGITDDGSMWFMFCGMECTPTQSYYIWCMELPTMLIFGVKDRAPQFTVKFGASAI